MSRGRVKPLVKQRAHNTADNRVLHAERMNGRKAAKRERSGLSSTSEGARHAERRRDPAPEIRAHVG